MEFKFLDGIPDSLRYELLFVYSNIARNYLESRWEPSELNGGKFCEVVYTIVKGNLESKYPNISSKPSNFYRSCTQLESYPGTSTNRSLRILIPRMLIPLYEVRNNRGVGHVGGDVNPNEMDAANVLSMCKWVMAELVRIYHSVSTEEAEAYVHSITERDIPLVWKVNGKQRILDTKLSQPKKTLLLLYGSANGLRESELIDWLELKRASDYRKDVLRKLHSKKWIEYDPTSQRAILSPTGASEVETNILPAIK